MSLHETLAKGTHPEVSVIVYRKEQRTGMSTANETKHPALAAIENKTAVVGIMGLGYVGLPLVRAFMDAGFKTMGYDVDQSKVDSLITVKKKSTIKVNPLIFAG